MRKPLKGKKQILKLPTKPTSLALYAYAGRIAALLSDPTVQTDTEVVGTLDDFLGAVYALVFAKEVGFVDRIDQPIQVSPVHKRARQMAARKVRIGGRWMAGFHFNSALFRIAAVYQRFLKIAVNKRGSNANVPTLQTEALSIYSCWNSITLNKMYSEVNELKHTPSGSYGGRLVTFKEGLSAIDDLLHLIEAWHG